MAETPTPSVSFTFSDFPEDVQLCILSFLTPSEITTFSLTSKRHLTLCKTDNNLWFSLCHRRWGSHTQIKKWGGGPQSHFNFKQLYKTLARFENLIGFWRRSGQGNVSIPTPPPPLLFFEWGPSFVTGSKVSPSKSGNNYEVIKTPFLWMGVSGDGDNLNFLDPDCRYGSNGEFVRAVTNTELMNVNASPSELVSVKVSFMGVNHIVVEENHTFYSPKSSFLDVMVEEEDGNEIGIGIGIESTSPGGLPDRLRSDIYQYFANRTSPSGDRASRRQRKKGRERLGRRKWEPEHFVKIVNSAPTPSRPLQGLWKGFCDDMSLDFYLVAYDDNGGIACRRLGDASDPFSGYSPVFWTSNTTFIEPPFSSSEEYLYDSRTHLSPPAAANEIHGHPLYTENQVVRRILIINCSYALVIPGSPINPRDVEGRIWLYADGTFGFGFLRNNVITDLKHIALDGCLLDTVESKCH